MTIQTSTPKQPSDSSARPDQRPSKNEGKNYRYLQLQTDDGTGYACVYLEWKKQNNQISFGAGLSFCSPKDNFVKDLARKMANQRFTKDRNKRVTGSIDAITKDPFCTAQEGEAVLLSILTNASKHEVSLRDRSGATIDQKHSLVPNWAQRAINAKRYKIGLRQEQADTKE